LTRLATTRQKIQTPLTIRQARSEDFDAILRINSQCVPHVAPLDPSELRRLVELASVVWIAVGATGIEGYLLGMTGNDDYDGEEFAAFVSRLGRTFLYVDQVAVSADARRERVASELYEHVALWSLKRDIGVLCCEVNLAPPNPASMSFHEQHGFERLDQLRTSDGRLVALLCKQLRTSE
jgi:uncharacterized protein